MQKKYNIISIPLNIKNITIAITVIGSVFSAGFYCGSIIQELKSNDKIMNLHIKIIDEKSEYENKLHVLREEIYELKLDGIKQNQHENK